MLVVDGEGSYRIRAVNWGMTREMVEFEINRT